MRYKISIKNGLRSFNRIISENKCRIGIHDWKFGEIDAVFFENSKMG